jgi:mono/diheme cytochrome c family protein
MKSRLTALTIFALILSACTFSLTEDVTPPPDYVPPTPMPTLGPLYPASAPDVENGAAIYAEKCAACHGKTGMGNGDQGKQLPVPVAALGLPDIARKASPAQWFTTISQGNLNRFMPPFTSLNEKERWDVVAYALTLHTNREELDLGKTLFDTLCEHCVTDFFTDQKKMAALSNADLVRIIKEGDQEVTPFGSQLSDDKLLAVAEYLRTLSFAPSPVAEVTSPVSPQTEKSATVPTPADGTPLAQVQPEMTTTLPSGTVSGNIENKTGAALPSDLKVTLRGLEHGADPNTGPQEVFTAEGTMHPDGSFVFENVDLPENRIFVAQTNHEGIEYQSDFAIVKAGDTGVVLPPFAIYATTTDISGLAVETLHMFFDYANESNVQIFSIYTMQNTGDKTIVVSMGESQEVPFIKFPAGAQSLGYETTQNSASFLPVTDGFAMPPAKSTYGLIAFASLPKEKKINISQPLLLPVDKLALFLPEGVKASGDMLTFGGLQQIQNSNFNTYNSGRLEAGSSLDFTLSGFPKNAGANADLLQNKTLIIGAGALGLAFILTGVWMYVRERKRVEDLAEQDESEYDEPQDILDAIIALDDLHRAGQLSEQTYQKRRAELKARLKQVS